MTTPTETERTSGFTLIEVLIVISLLSLLTGALTMSLKAMLAQTASSQTRMEISHDAQLAAAYFAEDVHSTGVRDSSGNPVKSIEMNAPPTSGTYPCRLPTGTLPNAAVRLAWDELSDGTTEVSTRVIVSYVVVPTATERQLHRVECRDGATADDVQVIAHNISAVTPPTLTCADLTTTPCDATTPPKRVSLNLTIAQPNRSDTLTVTLAGQRRQT